MAIRISPMLGIWIVAVAACQSRGAGSGGGGGADAGPPDASDGAVANRPPVILQASANTTRLRTKESMSIQAVATDPDGIADLIGGTVQSPASVTYAALVTSADEGAYQVELTWARINQTEPIVIPPGAQVDRPFRITMFDQAGASATTTVSVALASATAGKAVCAGEDVDRLSATHCGSCKFSCLDALGSTYGASGLCIDDGGVFCFKNRKIMLTAADGATTCGQACLQATGTQAFSMNVSSCDVVSGTSICPFGDCPSAAFANLPAGCVGPNTFVECNCDGYWQSPGY